MSFEPGRWLVRGSLSPTRPNLDPLLERAPFRLVRGTMPPAAVLLLVALSALLGITSCGRKAASAQDEAAQQLRAQQLIEAGNEAYRTGDHRLAARRYAAAAVVKKDDPAAYFGMGMALSKLGRDEEARTAYQRARELARTQAVLDFPGTHGDAGVPADTIP